VVHARRLWRTLRPGRTGGHAARPVAQQQALLDNTLTQVDVL